MIEKLTTFDPAELLTSDEAVAAFMADAFESAMLVTLPMHWVSLPARAEWLGLRKILDCRANSFIGLSASGAIQRSRPPWR